MMGCAIIGCSVRFYQLSWYIPDSSEFFGHWWSAILALTERAEDFQLKMTFTKYHKDPEGRESLEMEQMTAAYNNEPLSSPGWQTRLIRVRTWNHVFLKPGSILCKVSGTKSSYVLWGELGMWRCQLYLQCGLSQRPGQQCFPKVPATALKMHVQMMMKGKTSTREVKEIAEPFWEGT